MTVNELARRVGIPAHVGRYSTQCGLLSPARNAYREYGDEDVHRLKRVRARQLRRLIDAVALQEDDGLTLGRRDTRRRLRVCSAMFLQPNENIV